MAITAKSTGKSRQPVPAGNYLAVCIGVYDLGTQPPTNPQYDATHKVVLQYELHKKKGPARDKDDNILTISGFYPLAFGKRKNGEKSKLRQAVEGMLGRSFSEQEAKEGYDITQLLGMPCRLVVGHDEGNDGTVYDHIKSLSPLDEDDPEPKAQSSEVLYELDTDAEIPGDVPEWVARLVKKSREWQKANGGGDDDDRPRGKGRGGERDERRPASFTGSGRARRDDDDEDEDDRPRRGRDERKPAAAAAASRRKADDDDDDDDADVPF